MLIESVCIYIFTVEYVLRLFTVHTVPEKVWNIKEEALEEPDDDDEVHVKHEKGCFGLTKGYATTFMNLIDLVAILPFYLEAAIGDTGLGVIRVLRLTRVLRVLKSPKFAEAVKLFSLSLSLSIPALSILFFFNILGIILMGSLVFFESALDPRRRVLPEDVTRRASTEDVFHMPARCFIRPNYLAWATRSRRTRRSRRRLLGHRDHDDGRLRRPLPTTSFGRFPRSCDGSGPFGSRPPSPPSSNPPAARAEDRSPGRARERAAERALGSRRCRGSRGRADAARPVALAPHTPPPPTPDLGALSRRPKAEEGARGAQRRAAARGRLDDPNAKAAPRSGPISSGGRYEVSDVTEETKRPRPG